MAHRLEALVDGREIHGGANGLGEETPAFCDKVQKAWSHLNH